jgi:hypothetical protein
MRPAISAALGKGASFNDKVSSRVIVIVHQRQQHAALMVLPELDDMILSRRDLGTHTVLINSET